MTDLRPLHQIVDVLPASGEWTASKRARWLRAIEAAADWAIAVIPDELVASPKEGADGE